MCQLFGLSLQAPLEINRLLAEFFSHSDVHQHGWGFASFGEHITLIEKEPHRAQTSVYLQQILTRPLRATTAFAHIRLATVGTVTLENCHPFSLPDATGRRWTLIHNGTIRADALLQPYCDTQLGSTDSERILYALVDRINTRTAQTGECNVSTRAHIAADLFGELQAAGGGFVNALNLMVFDGDILYVYSGERFEEAGSARLAAIWRRRSKSAGGWLFATVPLGTERWELVPLNQLCIYRKGTELSL
ncbi:MAG: class II glutamine amidotransferase [Actinomycetes bacterium]|jgi:glutamine amidotransferase|nr:class II glutamine amidotransferase [Actinomycetes bacterium]